MLSTGQNEFILPKPLKSNNIISISFIDGNFPKNKQKLLFTLQSGTAPRGKLVLQIEIDFPRDTITVKTDKSVSKNSNTLKPSHIFKTSELSMTLEVYENSNGFEDTLQIIINMGIHAVDTVQINKKMLEDSTFFTLHYGLTEVKDFKLEFTYS